MKLAENAGYGFDKMLQWEKETNTKIVFDANIAYSVVTFTLPEEIQEITGNVPKDVPKDKRQEVILREIKKNPEITTIALAEQLGVNEKTIKRDISQLKKENKLARVDGRKNGKWLIIG